MNVYYMVLSNIYSVPELEDDDGEEEMPLAPRSEPRKRFNFTADESSPATRKPVKQRLSLGDSGTKS